MRRRILLIGLAVLQALLSASFGCGGPKPMRKNVVLVSIDTLRADRVGAYGWAGAQTPTLDSLAAHGVRFDRAFAPTPLTLPSHATLLTALDPPRHGVRYNGIHRLSDTFETLAERLSREGWETAAVVGSLVLSPASGLAQGFDAYDAPLATHSDELTGERSAEAVNERALEWLDGTRAPYFLFVHYYDIHASYAAPPPFDANPDPYDGEIAYVDAMLGQLIEGLAERELLESTLIVVTADHGESLGEHDERTHSYSIYDATQRVPLILKGPGLPEGAVVSGIVRSSDIPQTILGWVGAGSLENVDGVDLASTWRGPQTTPGVAYLESRATELNHGWSPLHGLRTEEYLYIRSPQPELYAVDSDPGQLQNLFDQVPDQAQHIASSLDLLLEQRLIDPQAATMVGLDTATRARLEALGYAMPNQPVPQTNLDPKQGRRTLARYAEVERLMNNALYEAAVRILEELLEVSPSSVRTQLLLTHAYLALDRLDAALEHAESATSLGPNRERTWRLLGIVRLERGQPGEASEAFRRAIEIDPATPGAQLRLVESLIAEGRIEAAKAQAARVTLLGFGNGRQLRRLADAWEAAGQSEMALDAYRRVLAIHPESPRDNMHFAIHLIRAGQQGVAEKHIALAGSEVAAQPKARHALAQAYLAIGDTEQARAVGWR